MRRRTGRGPDATLAGATELDIWQKHAKRWSNATADGSQSLPISSPADGRPTQADLRRRPGYEPTNCCSSISVPRVAGVSGDSCATFRDAEPSGEQCRAHAVARSALECGLEMLRPGTPSGEIDAAVRAVMAEDGWEYPHHTGHGVGFAWHEEPRIVPESDTVLQPGMVVALEPGAYAADWGLRVEQVSVVTDGAPRVLSGHSLAFSRLDG